MTNEERSQAIADMRRMKNEYMNGREMDEVAERKCKSFDIAIKALEQQPCDDAISCEAVIEWLKAKDIIKLSSQEETARKELKALPPVTPQQKYGKWIEHPEIETSAPKYLMFYECSECGDKPCFCKSDIHKKRFCSNCGCRMVEPQESEEV